MSSKNTKVKILPIDTMHGVNNFLLQNLTALPSINDEYLGPRGSLLSKNRNEYHKKRSQFFEKVKKYKDENKNILSNTKCGDKPGYKPDDELKETILVQREKDLETFFKSMDVLDHTSSENIKDMYENYEGRALRIRILKQKESFESYI